MENNYVIFEMEALPENQSLARGVVAAYLAIKDPTLEELTEIKTAVSEAVSNAIIHGYSKSGKGRIKIQLKIIDETKILIKITDYGKGITDIKKAMEPLFSTEEDKEMSGMGFTVMESFMDKVIVDSQPLKGTTVTLIKNLDTYYGL